MVRYMGSELSTDDVRQILALVENSIFESFELQVGDLHLSVSKTGAASAPTQPASVAPASTPTPAPSAVETAPAPVRTPGPASSSDTDVNSGNEAGLVEIKAPIVGLFYVAPEPGAKPFIEEGDDIDADTTVGLVEVMKVFNGVKAGVAGTVVKRLVDDSAFVEHGQALFLVREKT
ncbi:acetyl-CoA carboxylase biotin carboxyl carrier protein subunit [Amorphus sp. 3PC139-8]|uniref:acetyl-CoA carboxylase biotin carboxyl carrier protein n=1 Tax=Amorphus sp. 3PC139-8 TaxID=2735676 RepID=UPI00345C6323